MIVPVTASVAPPLDTTRYWGYTSVWNLLDYPGIAFPASSLFPGWEEDLASESYTPQTEMEASTFANYDPDVAQRMPVGLQVVAKRLEEGKLLGYMGVIDTILREP